MTNTKQTGRKYKSKEEEEAARKKMEEEARKKQKAKESKKRKHNNLEEGEIRTYSQESQEDVEEQGSRDQPPKKKKKKTKDTEPTPGPSKSMKQMSKSERKKNQEQLAEERKQRARAKKGAEEARYARMMEEHKDMLRQADALKRKAVAARSSTVLVPPAEAEEPTVTLPLDPELPTPGADILETSIVESRGPLNLNPLPSEEDNEDEPVGGAHYT